MTSDERNPGELTERKSIAPEYRAADIFAGIVIAAVVVVFVMAIRSDAETARTHEKQVEHGERLGQYSVTCLSGVKYLTSGRRMTVYINRETLTPERCKE